MVDVYLQGSKLPPMLYFWLVCYEAATVLLLVTVLTLLIPKLPPAPPGGELHVLAAGLLAVLLWLMEERDEGRDWSSPPR